MVKLLTFIHTDCHVDAELVRQANAERDYWHVVLERVAETICFLSEHALAFRGSDELIGSPRAGNYLGILELLGKFDPFLQQHINQNANKGRGSHFYLSKTVCDEFIQLMGKQVLERIFV